MRWSSNGIILNFSKHNEKSYILEIFTEEHGKHKGLIGAYIQKIKDQLLSQAMRFSQAGRED